MSEEITDQGPDHATGIDKWFYYDPVEISCQIENIHGQIPEWLRGSYYLNGPARFERNGFRYKHWLDGDGMLRALHFTDQGVEFISKFVETVKLRAERNAGKFIYRTFGTSFEGDLLRRDVMLEPPVNVSVYPFAEKLLAFAEQSIPIEIDSSTLETGEEFDFHSKLNQISPFSAHPKFDPLTGQMVNFGISFSNRNPMLHLYQFEADASLSTRRRFPIEMAYTNHDFALSPHFAVFFFSPLVMDFESFWTGGASVMEALRWLPQNPSYLYVAPRERGKNSFSIERPGGHCLHLINAFEEGDLLTVDLIEFPSPIYPEYQPVPEFYKSVEAGGPVRYVIDTLNHRLLERISMNYDRAPDFPATDPRKVTQPYEHFWMLGITDIDHKGRKFFDQLAHGSWKEGDVNDIYQSQKDHYLGGEPVLLPHPDSVDRGLIIIQCFDSKSDQVEFQLFDCQNVSSGPVARLPLKHKTPPGFHASFQSH
jgi:all-trans-8'-apo-beta-carotenal 15,15'-oxygenase